MDRLEIRSLGLLAEATDSEIEAIYRGEPVDWQVRVNVARAATALRLPLPPVPSVPDERRFTGPCR